MKGFIMANVDIGVVVTVAGLILIVLACIIGMRIKDAFKRKEEGFWILYGKVVDFNGRPKTCPVCEKETLSYPVVGAGVCDFICHHCDYIFVECGFILRFFRAMNPDERIEWRRAQIEKRYKQKDFLRHLREMAKKEAALSRCKRCVDEIKDIRWDAIVEDKLKRDFCPITESGICKIDGVRPKVWKKIEKCTAFN